MKIILLLGILLLPLVSLARADDMTVPYTQSDRDRSVRIEQRLDDLEKRMDGLDERMNRLENRMDRLETKVDTQFQTVYIMFITGFVGLIGFVLWDRRSMVKPVAEDQRSLSAREAKLEQVLREYAKTEPRLAELLKQYALW